MADGYTDEELAEGVRPPRVPPLTAAFIGRLAHTIARLQRERDEARAAALKEAIGTVYSVSTLSDGEANMQAEIVRELSRLRAHSSVHSQDGKTGNR